MLRELRIKFFAIVLLTAFAAYIVAPIPNKPKILSGPRINPGIDLAGGAELRYKVLFEPGFKGDRQQATHGVTDVLRRRVEGGRLSEPKINSHGDDEIIVQLAGVDADGLRDLKRRIGSVGKLQLFAAAPQDLQERYAKDRIVPEGHKVVKLRDGASLLVERNPVIEGRHVVNAEPQQQMTAGGIRWVTAFELDAEGAKLFDEAAERLYHQRPRGRIVILLDDEVRSAPVVESPAFHGRGQISGGRE